jgi:DNA-binding NarL/FixJ family response regulator
LLRAKDPVPTPAPPRVVKSLFGRYGLTRRQSLVADLITDGLSNLEIAQEIGTTEQVVKNHIKAIFEKIGTTKRGQVVLVALGLRKPVRSETAP